MPDNVSAKAIELTANVSPNIPASYDGNPLLYAASLNSLTLIAFLGTAIVGWMVRDCWRDRFSCHPLSLLFGFRIMMAIIGVVAVVRTVPEVLYLQAYGERNISPDMVAAILTLKRFMDTVTVSMVLSWMLLFVSMYPWLCLSLKSGPVSAVRFDVPGVWMRLRRPLCLVIVVTIISSLMAYSKVYGG